MGTLPALESYTTNIVSAFDCDLVIPALNEEARLGDTIASLHEATTAESLNLQYIVVDNGCVDATADVVETVRRLDVSIEYMSCQTRGSERR
jgi:dolichyl-phosphate beta-glucosyltransferase